MKHRLSLRRVFALPFAIGILSSTGLVSALTGDGWRDGLSWIGLAVPVFAVAWAIKIRRT